MGLSDANQAEVILEEYRGRIDALRDTMHFRFFDNGKPYSFDYHLKPKFDTLVTDINTTLKKKGFSPSPYITNHIPVFLPPETKRIAFFSYRSKSVREVKTNELATLLTKQALKRARLGEISFDEIETRVEADIKTFKEYDASHDFDGYRRDVFTNTVQFNAYDENDELLLEKSFVRGGLVFDLKPEEFPQIEITYPRRRKRRSDKKEDFLPLKLIQIRGIKVPKDKQDQ